MANDSEISVRSLSITLGTCFSFIWGSVWESAISETVPQIGTNTLAGIWEVPKTSFKTSSELVPKSSNNTLLSGVPQHFDAQGKMANKIIS